MFTNLLIFMIIFALFCFFARLTVQAVRSQKLWLRLAGGIPAGLVALLLLVVVGVSARGLYFLYKPYGRMAPDVQGERTPERIARGEHLASVVCASCHSLNSQLPLSGGTNLSADTGLPLGNIYPSNLTPAGDLPNWTDGQIVRAVRESVHRTGRKLLMPNGGVMQLSDEDLMSIIVYLRSQPAVVNNPPATQASFLLAILSGANIFKSTSMPADVAVAAPAREITAAYGDYLVTIADCRDCHGQDFSGGKPPTPPGPSLQSLSDWTEEEFIQSMRTGFRPDKTVLLPPMPWRTIGKLDDIELAAIYRYITGGDVTASQ